MGLTLKSLICFTLKLPTFMFTYKKGVAWRNQAVQEIRQCLHCGNLVTVKPMCTWNRSVLRFLSHPQYILRPLYFCDRFVTQMCLIFRRSQQIWKRDPFILNITPLVFSTVTVYAPPYTSGPIIVGCILQVEMSNLLPICSFHHAQSRLEWLHTVLHTPYIPSEIKLHRLIQICCIDYMIYLKNMFKIKTLKKHRHVLQIE